MHGHDQRTDCVCAGTGVLHAEERGGHRPYSCTTCRKPGLPIDYWAMVSHRQRLITHEDRAAWVDGQMAPLVLRLWEHGVETLFSCQGGPSHVNGNITYLEGIGDCYAGGEQGYLSFVPTPLLSVQAIVMLLEFDRYPYAFWAEETPPHQHPRGVRFVTLRFPSLADIYQGDVGLGGPARSVQPEQYRRWAARQPIRYLSST